MVHTYTLLTHPLSVLVKPNVPSYTPADGHTLISLFSGRLIPRCPYAAYMDYHMLLKLV